ncbi:MAG: glycosyltransferase family 2 protein [Anaerolineae bacterium]|nr:glycosyltransferase family 2 protein [Anaerolineae bacterium]
MSSLSISFPAYNEADNIGQAIEDTVHVAAGLTDDFEVIVVDDGSVDRTADVVRAFTKRYPQVRLIEHEVNQGYGAAVYDGLVGGVKEWAFFTDSDLQFVMDDLADLWAVRDQADLVIGYRAPRQDPFIRKLNGFGWTWLTNVLFGYVSRDVDCAFKLIRRDVVDAVAPTVASRGATLSAEFLVRAKRMGYRTIEVPVTHRARVAGSQTGAKLKVILRAFGEMFRFRLQMWREKAP